MAVRYIRIYLSLFIISSFLLLSSCGEFDKLMKSQDYELIYSKVKEYYANGKYSQAASMIEKILPHYRGTTKSEELDYLHAKCYYEMGDYVMASHYFETFVGTYINSDHADDADFLMGFCYYKLSPRPELDQTNTYNALNDFALHKTKFPNSKYNEQCDKLSKELQEKLAEKSFLSAKLYFRLEQYKAAIIAIGNSLEDFPDTKFREELMFLRLKSKYLYAQNSVRAKQPERFQETVDDYYSFIDEFPKSRFIKEANKIYNNCNNYLSIK
ncbi:MAG TPA: outer membrane protein assembly factor BamD [Bacteroidetes bacterium]|nr:outer membrane protein assembly factor BamD [Bacteroidota bacterium]